MHYQSPSKFQILLKEFEEFKLYANDTLTKEMLFKILDRKVFSNFDYFS